MDGRPAKTDALIRDIAKLFVTYSPTVWRPVLDDLARAGGSYEGVARQIEYLLAKAASEAQKARGRRTGSPKRSVTPTKPTGRTPKKNDPAQASPDFSPARQDTLGALATALNERRLLPTAGDIRHVYLESGGKGDLPKVRKAAILHLLRHLDTIPSASFEAIHEAVHQHANAQDTAGDYQRWFQLIRKP